MTVGSYQQRMAERLPHTEVLQGLFTYLRDHMNVNRLLSHLLQSGLIINEHFQELRRKHEQIGSYEATESLLMILIRQSDPQTLQKLEQCLLDTGQEYIVHEMKQEEARLGLDSAEISELKPIPEKEYLRHTDIFRQAMPFLEKHVKTNPLLSHLLAAELLTSDEVIQIEKQEEAEGSNGAAKYLFIEILNRSPDPACLEKVVEALHKTGQTKIVEYLEEGYQQTWKRQTNQISAALKTLYKRLYSKVRHIPWKDDSWLSMNEIYIPLTMQERKQGLDWQTVIKSFHNYNQFFVEGIDLDDDENVAKRVVIKGHPGSGKTTQCDKMALDWAQGQGVIAKYDLLFLVRARELELNHDLNDFIVQTLPTSLINHKEIVSKLFNSNMFHILLVIDGYDELVEKRYSEDELKEILWNKLNHKCDVVITTRPWCTDELKSRHVDFVLNICAFDEPKIRSYIKKYFTSQKQNEVDATHISDKLIAAISKQKLWKLMQVPLCCLFLCLIWEFKDGNMPTLKTEMYIELLKAFREIYTKRNKVKLVDDTWDRLLKSLGNLAYCKLVSENSALVFEKKELVGRFDIDIDLACSIGLLTRSESMGSETSFITATTTSYFSFFHLTVQEFLAAHYLYNYVGCEINMTPVLNRKNDDFSLMIVLFTCGLYSHDKTPHTKDRLNLLNQLLSVLQHECSSLDHIKENSRMDTIVNFQHSVYKQIQMCWEEAGYNPKLKWNILLPDLIKDYTQHNLPTSRSIVSANRIDLEKITSLIADARTLPEAKYMKHFLTQHGIDTRNTCNLCLKSFLNLTWNMNQLSIVLLKRFQCKCRDRCTSLEGSCKQLEYLNISHCELDEDDITQIGKALNNSKVQVVDLSYNKEKVCAHLLLEYLPTTVKEIKMFGFNFVDGKLTIQHMDKSLVKKIEPNLKKIGHVELLNIQNSPQLGSDVTLLLETFNGLAEVVYLENCGLKAGDSYHIGKCLNKFEKLNSLCLLNNNELHTGVAILFEYLPSSVQEITCANCGVESKELPHLFPLIRKFDCLHTFKLKENGLTDLCIDLSYSSKVLILSGSLINENIATAIKEFPLEVIVATYEECKFTSDHTVSHNAYMGKFIGLKKLDFHRNEGVAKYVDKILQDLPTTITHMEFSKCDLTTQNALKMSVHLNKFDKLNTFNVHGNSNMKQGIGSILEELPKTVSELILSCCGFSTTEGQMIGNHIRNFTSLKRLSFGGNKEIRTGMYAIITNIPQSVRKLDIRYCGLTDGFIDFMKAHRPSLKSSLQLRIKGNNFSEWKISELKKMFKLV